ncbi:putative ribonuclease H-like domain-containing protein [Tanacetum coccineum]
MEIRRVPIPVTAPESGPSTALKMTVPSTTEEKICKKNDIKARNLLLMALLNEHQLTFNQYADAQSMFIAIKARFEGNDATKKTQKALLKQYENFNATSSESLDSIFNKLQKLVSRLAILSVDTSPEDLNVKFLRSLPSEWDTHVVVWMNKPDFETMGLDDLYNNFKIVEQKVKRTVAVNNDDKNLAFLTTSSPSSTNTINTVNTGVSTGNTKVNTARSQLVHEDLEQIHDDDLEEMDLKWNMALLSMRARKFYQRTGRKIIIDGSSTAGYDKSKVECYNCHKLGHFARECRVARSKDNRNWNSGSSSKAVRIEDASEKAMCAIDGTGFDWSGMADDEIQANMALMAFTDSEVSNDKSCSKSCLKNYEALKKQYDDLLVKLDDTAFKAATYKRDLSILEAQVVKYKESEVLFSKEIALLKRSVGHKDYLMGLVKTELEKVKEEKEGFEFKLAKFEKSSKDLDALLASQVTDKSKKGFGYNSVPSPHPLILNRPTPLDLSYSGLAEFKQPEVNEYGPRNSSLKSTIVCDRESNNSKENTDDSLTQQPKTVTETSSVKSPLKADKAWKEKFFYPANNVRVEEPTKDRENTDAPIIEDWVSNDKEEVEPIPKEEKKTAIPTATKKDSVKTDKPSRRSVRYAEIYRSQKPRGNQRSWNGQKSNQLGCNFVFNNKACFIYGNFDHIQYNCPNAYKYIVPRAVLMKTSLKTVKNAKPLSTVRSVNTARPFSTARSVNTIRPYNTAHPKSTVACARPKTHFQNQAQRPFYKNTALTKRSNIQNINTGRQTVNTVRPNVNTVRARGNNVVKPSACWVWRPIKPNGASLSNSQLNDKGFVDSGCLRHMSRNIAHLSDFKDFDGGYVTFGGGANGGRITGKGTIKTDKLDFEDLLDESQILLKIPRQNNMYSFDMKNLFPKDGLTCLVAKATSEESMLWHRRLGHVNFKNINKLFKENLVSIREYVCKEPQLNGVAEERIGTSLRVLIVKPHNKTPYELFRGIKPAIGFMKPFGCHVTILNTLDKLGKFDGKSDEGFFVGYSLSSKAFRVYNIRTRKVQENLHVGFLENKPMIEGNGPKWLFDLDSLTQSMNYVPVVAGTFSNVSADQDGTHDDCSLQNNGTADQQVNTASPDVNTGSREVSTAVPEVNTATPEDLMGPIPTSEDTQVEDQEIELGNISHLYAVSSTPHTRIHKRFIQLIMKERSQGPNITCLFACFYLKEEPNRVSKALSDPAWVEAMQEELLQFKLQNVWVLVDLPKGHRAIGFEDPDHPDKVYKVVKALYGLHQAPRACQKGYTALLVQIYVDDIIFGSTKKELCDEFEKLMKDKFQMSSMGELTFFLGLQVQQRKKGIFISQDKYVHEILRKFNYTDVKSASTPTDLEKPLVKDADADDVDEHLYRSMIGSLMYLTASRPDIMFAVCACARFQVSPKTSHLLAVKRIFRYLKGKPSLGLWYSKDSPLELVAYTDSDYAGATLDRKSTTGGCQFLGNRLISWQCKKQTVVATSTTEAEYVAAASCCGQVLWIQNQLLDYGYNFMNTVIYIDNTSTICIIENPVQHSKTKHIEIRHHFIRDCNTKKLIQMAKIDTQLNVADLLTKGFDAGRFQYLVSSIGMLNP